MNAVFVLIYREQDFYHDPIQETKPLLEQHFGKIDKNKFTTDNTTCQQQSSQSEVESIRHQNKNKITKKKTTKQ